MTRPKDSPTRKKESKGVGIVHYKLDSDHWLFRQETGNDVGRDCIIELSENDEWLNHKIEGQIKATSKPQFISSGSYISFSMEVKTICYALGSPIAFVLFVVDLNDEEIYYECIQDYFIAKKELFDKLTQGTITINIPVSRKLSEGDERLQEMAKATFVDGPERNLKRHLST